MNQRAMYEKSMKSGMKSAMKKKSLGTGYGGEPKKYQGKGTRARLTTAANKMGF